LLVYQCYIIALNPANREMSLVTLRVVLGLGFGARSAAWGDDRQTVISIF
jgi:hypothetical protein